MFSQLVENVPALETESVEVVLEVRVSGGSVDCDNVDIIEETVLEIVVPGLRVESDPSEPLEIVVGELLGPIDALDKAQDIVAARSQLGDSVGPFVLETEEAVRYVVI